MPVPKGQRYGGRQKGTKNKATIDKELQLEVLRQIVAEEIEPMTRAQIASAKGVSHFFLRNDAGQFVEVTDPKMIQTALNAGEEGKYYWVHTQNPSTSAFADLMNRTYGKPPERHEMTGADGGPIEITINKPWAK